MTLRIALIGCVESSQIALQALLATPAHQGRVVGVLTRQRSTFNADFVDISTPAAAAGIPVLHVEDARDDAAQAAWLRSLAPDVVFCIGWSQLLGEAVMQVAPRGVIGFHPAALPANRGRHPLIWALALGLDRTASSFFMIEAEADSGALLSQVPIDISPSDDARTLYDKVMAVVPGQLRDIVGGLSDGSLVPQPQDDARANHWRKRSARDGLIDWRMGAIGIVNLVRALTRPYPGAEAMHQDAPVKVWKCVEEPGSADNVEPGKVLRIDGREVTVKCGQGAVRLTEHEFPQTLRAGDYL
jgi:methionyl-tRNA formyltransferase